MLYTTSKTMPRGARSYELAPVEIWKEIITLVIDSSLLLSSNPFKSDWHESSRVSDWICPMYNFDDNGTLYWGLHDKPAMKQFRNIRSVLRRVCRSWKDFLDSPNIEHRCMRFCIPSHADDERDPAQVVLAKRIEVINNLIGASSQLDGALWEAIEKGIKFRADILLDIGGKLVPQIFPKYRASFPFLTTLLIDFQDHSSLQHRIHLSPREQENLSVIRQLSSLTTLVVCLPDTEQFRDPIFLRLPSLTSLSVTGRNKLPYLDFSQWAPSLRHLELVGVNGNDQFTYFFRHLHRFASQIQYLRLVPCKGIHVSWTGTRIWECHKLERLEMPLQLGLIGEESRHKKLAQLKHIVHSDAISLIMVAHDWNSSDFMPTYGMLIGACLKLPALKTITDIHRWETIFRKANTPLEEGEPESRDQNILSSAAASTMVLAHKLQAIGFRFEDREHTTMTEARAKAGLT